MASVVDREASIIRPGLPGILKYTLVAIAVIWGATASHASTLIGSSIQAAYYFPSLGSNYVGASVLTNPFTVGAGVETTIDVEGVTFLQVDFSATSLVITLNTILTAPTWNNGPDPFQNGPSFKVLSGNPFTNIASVVASNSGPISAYLLAGELIVNWAGMPYADGDTVTIEFAPIPLPAGLGLLVLGLGALGWAGRRRHPA